MMIPFSNLKRKRFRLDAFDGTLGQAHDLYLTDENWTIRYLIARLGSRFKKRRVLLPVYLVERTAGKLCSPFGVRCLLMPEG